MRGASLRTTLVVVFCILGALPCILLGIIEVRRVTAAEFERGARERALVASAVTDETIAFIKSPKQATQALSNITNLIGIDSPSLSPFIRAQREFFASAFMCYVADERGVVRAADPPVAPADGKPMIGRDYSDRDYFPIVRDTVRPYLTEILVSRSTGEKTIAVIAPLVNDDGVFGGIMTCALTIDDLQDRVDRLTEQHETLSVYLVDHKGNFVLHPDRTRRGEKAQGALFLSVASAGIEERADNDDQGRPVVASALRVLHEDESWTIVVAQRESDAAAAGVAAARSVLLTLIIAFAIAAAAGVFLSRWIARPFFPLVDAARAIGNGDLTHPVPEPRGVELEELQVLLASLAGTFEHVRQNLRSLRDATSGIDGAVSGIAQASARVSAGGDNVKSAASEVGRSIDAIRSAIGAARTEIATLAQNTRHALSLIDAMKDATTGTAVEINHLHDAVRGTQKSASAQLSSAQAVAQATTECVHRVDDTSRAIAGIDEAIRAIEVAAEEAAALSSEASADAAAGATSIRGAIAGMDEIKNASVSAAQAMRNLDQRIGGVTGVVQLIDDVANTTRLLALNASILAAQAGAAGKGFNVVADEIKRLAEQTARSVADINDMIRRVQAASEDALSAVATSETLAQEGADLSGRAESALEKIVTSSERTTKVTRSIAEQTSAQATRSRSASTAMTTVSRQVGEIARAAKQQAESAREMSKRAADMEDATEKVGAAVRSQSAHFADLASAIANTSSVVTSTNDAQRREEAEAQRVLQSAERVQNVAAGQADAVAALDGVLKGLRHHSESLRRELSRFRLDDDNA